MIFLTERSFFNAIRKQDNNIEFTTVEIPRQDLATIRRKIRESVWQNNQSIFSILFGKINGEDYFRMVHMLSDPNAILRVKFFSGTNIIQNTIDIVMITNKLCFVSCVVMLLLSLILFNIMYLFVGIVLFMLSYFVFNNIQTLLNIEIGARLILYDNYMFDEELHKDKLLILKVK